MHIWIGKSPQLNKTKYHFKRYWLVIWEMKCTKRDFPRFICTHEKSYILIMHLTKRGYNHVHRNIIL